MKVGHLVCVSPPYGGGMGVVAANMAAMTAEEGIETVLFAPGKIDSSEIVSPHLTISRFRPWLKIGHGAYLPGLARHLSGIDILVYHYPFFGMGGPLISARKKLGFKLHVWYHMDAGRLRGIKALAGLFVSRAEVRVIEACDRIGVASRDYFDSSSAFSLIPGIKDRSVEIPFTVDKRFSSVMPSAGGKNIVFIGGLDRAHYFKGVDILIEAWSRLAPAHPDWRLKVIGRGELRSELMIKAARLGVGDRTDLLELDDDGKHRELGKAGILVLPSRNGHEAFGLVLLEAMAYGIPVIASRLPGVRTVFREGREGLFAEPGNAGDLAAKIEALIADPSLRARCGAAAKELFRERYGWTSVKARYLRDFLLSGA